MARMRTIKPEFWTDSIIVTLSPFARLLYIGMWNFALCDDGHIENDPIRIKLQILPMDSIEIGSLLDELLDSNRISPFESSDGKKYFHIPTLKSQQKGDPRWNSRCPACKDAVNASPNHRGVSARLSEPPRNSPELKKNSLVEERRVEEGSKDLSIDESIDDTKKPRINIAADFAEWYAKYPRKEAKGAALKAFTKVRKTVTLEELLTGVQRYSASIVGKERQHIALPATWLNAGRWEDDYGPIQNTGNQVPVPSQYRMFNP